MPKKTTETFIDDCKNLLKSNYDYSRVKYNGVRVKVEIDCKEHGSFWQTPNDHLRGRGCPACANILNSNRHRENTEIFVDKATKLNGNKFSYTKVQYIKSSQPVIITCNMHGDFSQTPNNHLRGQGCPKCSDELLGTYRQRDTSQFVNSALIIHRSKYSYDEVEYISSLTKIKIVCPAHGTFQQTPAKHLYGHGCPKCKESKGERSISQYLTENCISHKPQYSIPECRNILPLKFDFAIFDNQQNLLGLIEYQGEQHYQTVKHFGGKSKKEITQKRDKIKLDYCQNNDIALLRIPYTDHKVISQRIAAFVESLLPQNNSWKLLEGAIL